MEDGTIKRVCKHRTGAVNVKNKVVDKFRRTVEKRLLRKQTLATLEHKSAFEVNAKLITAIFCLARVLEEMAPKGRYNNIGEKISYIAKNMFMNDFLGNI